MITKIKKAVIVSLIYLAVSILLNFISFSSYGRGIGIKPKEVPAPVEEKGKAEEAKPEFKEEAAKEPEVTTLSWTKVKIPVGSERKVIENFNDGKDPNEIGGNPSIEVKKPTFLQAAYNKKITHGAQGYSLEIEFYIPKEAEGSWSTSLNELDISQSKGIGFWIKGSEGAEEFWVRLEDGEGVKKEIKVTDYAKITTEWQEVKITIENFSGINLDRVGKFTLLFKGDPHIMSGKIYLDDIYFYGEPELFFKSLKDNIAYYPDNILMEDERKELITKSDTLSVLEALPRWHGLWDNYYSTTNLQVTRRYISSVDNGWLAGGLIIVRQAFDEQMGKRCSKLLYEMDFSALYNRELGQINLGYDTEKNELSPYHYGQLNSEARFTSLIAIGKGDTPKEHWHKVHRDFPLAQRPTVAMAVTLNMELLESDLRGTKTRAL